jgi:2-methylcitrate dehydratase PrpD
LAKIDNLIAEYNIAIILLDRVRKGFSEHQQEAKKEYYKRLAKIGFRIKLETEQELELMFEQVESIRTQIKMLEDEVQEVQKGKPKSLMFQLKMIEKNLGFTVALNPKKLSVKEFIELCKELENGNQ